MDNTRGLLYFCMGCAARTVVTALMFTSKSGRETVGYLRGKAEEGTRTVAQSVDHLSQAVSNATTRGLKAVRHQTENVGAAVEAGKQAFRSAQDTTP